MSVRILARVWAQSRRRDGELLVMLALADFANDAGECWPSIPVLAEKARLTDRQVRRVLNSLEETGEIRRIRSTGGRNKRSRYFINLSENPDINSLKKLQGKNNPVIHDQKTLTPVPGALNRHRTVNKERVKGKPSPCFDGPAKGDGTSEFTLEEGFNRFWNSYPIRTGKGTALRAWKKLKPDSELQAKIQVAIKAQIQWREERAGVPKLFTPEWKHPTTWLNAMAWEDQVEDVGERSKPKTLFYCNRCGTSHPDGEHTK